MPRRVCIACARPLDKGDDGCAECGSLRTAKLDRVEFEDLECLRFERRGSWLQRLLARRRARVAEAREQQIRRGLVLAGKWRSNER